MNYIYAIICHKCTNPLIFTVNKLLSSEKSIVIIHVDAKATSEEFEKINLVLGSYKNLKIVSRADSINVNWGSFSQIEVMLLLMREAREYKFEYFSLISGDDIPVSSNEEREFFFVKSYQEKKEFIGFTPKHNAEDRLAIKYPNLFFSKSKTIYSRILKKLCLSFLRIFAKNKISSLPKLYKGSNWFTLTDSLIDYILDYVDNNPEYVECFKKSFCADEVFFHTIIFNSLDFRKEISGINDNLDDCVMSKRYIDWKTGPDYPRTLDESDFDKIRKSNFLFARKVKNNLPLDILENNFN